MPSSVGGAERVTINYSCLLETNKYKKVFVLIGNDFSNVRRLIPTDSQIYEIRIKNINRWGIIRILKILLIEKPDFVFSSMFWVNVRVLIAAKLLGIKTIVRNNINLDRLQKWMIILVKLTYRFAYKIIVQQEEMYDEMAMAVPMIQEKVQIVYNPLLKEEIDVKKNNDNPFTKDNEIKILCVGRISEEKGQDVLIEAFSIVVRQITQANLYFVGKYSADSSFYKRLVSIVNKYGLNNKVHFCGFDSNPYRWMNNCDCLVMPSRLEGLPNVLIEAMYLKKAVVATTCIPIVSRIVKDRYNGFLVESENFKKMASAIIDALKLKDFEMTYTPADKEIINRIFE